MPRKVAAGRQKGRNGIAAVQGFQGLRTHYLEVVHAQCTGFYRHLNAADVVKLVEREF